MIKRLLLFISALLLLPAQAFAQDLEGTWAFRIGDATIFTFEISESEDGEWHGRWTRPEDFASNGVVFARMVGSEEVEAMAALEFAGTIELSFDDPRPGAVPDIFNFRLMGPNTAEMTYVGTEFDPYPLIRVAPDTPLGPFDEDAIYDRDNAVTEADYIEPEELNLDDVAAPEENVEPAEDLPEPEAEEEGDDGLPGDFLEGLDG